MDAKLKRIILNAPISGPGNGMEILLSCIDRLEERIAALETRFLGKLPE